MKEYKSKAGGRYIFNEDIENLQELALSMTEMFKDSGVNFVISGCEITVTEDDGQYNITIGSGFAFINDKIVKVEELTTTVPNITNILILKNMTGGPDIMYADGSVDSQYDSYYGDVRVNFTNMGSLTPAMRKNMLFAYTDDDDNWLFPNLKTGYFTHYGLNNDGLFINVASQEQFNFDKNKVYMVGKYPAQYRLFDEVMPMDALFTDEQLNVGFAAFVPKANVNSILTGIAKWYCYIISDLTAAINIVNSDGTFGEDVYTFRLTKRGDDYHTFTIDNAVVSVIEDGIENAPNYSGVAIRIISGNIDINDSYIKTSKIIEFGVCKSNYPETLYRYIFDNSESTIVCTFINSVSWGNCSRQEKALWKPTIDNGEIDNSKFADGAVTNEKLADGAVTNEKLAANALICNISSYMNIGESILPMGKIYMYGVYPLEVRTCRVGADELPALVLAWYRGNEDDLGSSYPNPERLFVYLMAEDSYDFVYEGSYYWNNAPDKYKSIYQTGVPDGSITLDKLANVVKNFFWKRPSIYDQDNAFIADSALNLERLRGPLSIDPVPGENDTYVLKILAPSLVQFNSLVSRVEALENANNS